MTTATSAPPSSNGNGPKTPDLAACVAKVHTIEAELNGVVIESEEFIHRLILAILSRTHIYVTGEGGSGKSWATGCGAAHFALPIFYEIMQPDTKKEQIWGPISMKGLTEDRYEHAIQDFLATAGIALINEAKDANAFLRQLLDAMEERIFKNGTRVLDLPLNSLIATSNFEIEPNERHLAAFNDRFAQRFVQEAVQSRDGLVKILASQVERDRHSGGKYVPQTIMAPAELLVIQRAIVDCDVPAHILATIADLDADAKRQGVEQQSSRRLGAGRRLAQTDAVLAGHGQVAEENLHVFARVLASHSEEFAECDKLCRGFKGKVAEAVDKLSATLEEIVTRLAPAHEEVRQGKPVSNFAPLGAVAADLAQQVKLTEAAIKDAVANGRSAAPLEALLAAVEAEQEFITYDAMGVKRK
jgi:MoxR-like ATPase